jgi:hypothetical protein
MISVVVLVYYNQNFRSSSIVNVPAINYPAVNSPIINSPVVNVPPGGIACTQEAKLCPDGSYVGRTGPNCEFTACPEIIR